MKRIATTIGIATLTSLVAACGGGGSGGGGGGGGDTTFSTSGIAIDGYLQNAEVCIDVNLNGACDSGEPQTTTDNDGNFSFSGLDESFDDVPFLVVATAGEATDAGNAIATTFSLRAPAGAGVVTPLTTIIQQSAEQKFAGGSEDTMADAVAAAKSDLLALLGGAEGSLDPLNDDYVAAQSDGNSDVADAGKRLAAISQAVNQLIIDTTTTLLGNLTTSQKQNLDANGTLDTIILNVVAEKVAAQLATIASDVTTAIGNGDSVADAANAAATNATVQQPTFTELSQEMSDLEKIEEEVSGDVDEDDATGATGGSGG